MDDVLRGNSVGKWRWNLLVAIEYLGETGEKVKWWMVYRSVEFEDFCLCESILMDNLKVWFWIQHLIVRWPQNPASKAWCSLLQLWFLWCHGRKSEIKADLLQGFCIIKQTGWIVSLVLLQYGLWTNGWWSLLLFKHCHWQAVSTHHDGSAEKKKEAEIASKRAVSAIIGADCSAMIMVSYLVLTWFDFKSVCDVSPCLRRTLWWKPTCTTSQRDFWPSWPAQILWLSMRWNHQYHCSLFIPRTCMTMHQSKKSQCSLPLCDGCLLLWPCFVSQSTWACEDDNIIVSQGVERYLQDRVFFLTLLLSALTQENAMLIAGSKWKTQSKGHGFATSMVPRKVKVGWRAEQCTNGLGRVLDRHKAKGILK